jgi:RNA polymerase-binding transcription factor DksA
MNMSQAHHDALKAMLEQKLNYFQNRDNPYAGGDIVRRPGGSLGYVQVLISTLGQSSFGCCLKCKAEIPVSRLEQDLTLLCCDSCEKQKAQADAAEKNFWHFLRERGIRREDDRIPLLQEAWRAAIESVSRDV